LRENMILSITVSHSRLVFPSSSFFIIFTSYKIRCSAINGANPPSLVFPGVWQGEQEREHRRKK
jgi:hypothetical protein